MWGVGSPDDRTLPSAFGQLASEAGLPVRVVNRGEDGYVQWQEILAFEELLAGGEVPDLAVFYDGVNDVFAHFQDPPAGAEGRIHQNQRSWDARFENRLGPALSRASAVHVLLAALAGPGPKTFDVTWRAQDWGTPDDVGARVGERYMQGARHLEKLAAAYGVEVAIFWQPSVYSRPAIARTDEEAAHVVSFGEQAELGTIYDVARSKLGAPVVDLGSALDAVEGPVYVDWCHVGPAGNRILAGAILDRVRDRLR